MGSHRLILKSYSCPIISYYTFMINVNLCMYHCLLSFEYQSVRPHGYLSGTVADQGFLPLVILPSTFLIISSSWYCSSTLLFPLFSPSLSAFLCSLLHVSTPVSSDPRLSVCCVTFIYPADSTCSQSLLPYTFNPDVASDGYTNLPLLTHSLGFLSSES